MANEVLLEVQGHVALITMNRPQVHNAVDPAMAQGLRDAFLRLRDDPDLRVGVLTGAGERAFTAGADLKVMAGRTPSDLLQEFFQRPPGGRYVDLYKPVVAAVNGYCYAEGLNLLTGLTDIRIASERATFCYAEVLRGFSGMGEAIQWLPRQVPYAVAMDWLLTGRVFDAQEALRYGLVSAVAPPDQVKQRALEVAHHLAGLAPLALRTLKEAVLRGLSLDVPNAIKLTNALGTLNRFTEDAQEGPRAFAEKRPPRYRGR